MTRNREQDDADIVGVGGATTTARNLVEGTKSMNSPAQSSPTLLLTKKFYMLPVKRKAFENMETSSVCARKPVVTYSAFIGTLAGNPLPETGRTARSGLRRRLPASTRLCWESSWASMQVLRVLEYISLSDGNKAGEVPRIQYMLADESHHVIIGNVV